MRLLPPLKQLSQIPAVAQNSFASAERLFEVLDQPTEQRRSTTARATHRGFRDDDRLRRRLLRLRRRAGARRHLLHRAEGRRRRARRRERGGEEHARRSHPALLRADRAAASCSTASTRARSRSTSLRALTGIVSQETVLFNDTVRANIAYGRERAVHRRADRGAPRAPRTRTPSSPSCPTATTRSSASAARGSPAASASASPSRARCSSIRRSSSSTRRRARSTPSPSDWCRRRSTACSPAARCS